MALKGTALIRALFLTVARLLHSTTGRRRSALLTGGGLIGVSPPFVRRTKRKRTDHRRLAPAAPLSLEWVGPRLNRANSGRHLESLHRESCPLPQKEARDCREDTKCARRLQRARFRDTPPLGQAGRHSHKETTT